ncbi:ABC transporter substrate-binding protein [Vibrio nigripulchritudo]|uniref:ABC transporter substrate-binding protein n=1 Tax=Vibrio nigripulchritudo TaxID=28173 RepID=UPI0003B18FA8|nr:extracellular solute-binding protein [Vibrio nigripulchritudo]CCN69315.1 putative ABC-type sugar transport system,periplasmic component [Vibrio nigripulchritudo SFn118]
MKSRRIISLSTLFIALLSAPLSAKETVTVWSWFVQGTMQKSIEAFEKNNPDIDVKYTYYNYSPEYLTALKASAVSGGLPDVIGLQPGSFTQRYREHLAPLNGFASKEWGDAWIKNVFPINVRQMRMGNPVGDENFYILPQESQVLAIWYNRKIFEQLGISVPKSYSQLVSASKTLSDKGYIPMFQGAADGWQNINVFLMLANQYSPGLIEKAQYGQAKWTDPALVKAMKSWKKLFDDGVFQTGALGAHAYPTGAQLFAQGRVGMMALGSWWMQESKFPPPLSEYVQNMDGFDFFHLPAMPDSDRASPPIGGIDIGYGLTKNGKDNPAAWKFLASLVNGEALQQALNDLNDLPAFEGHGPKGDISAHVHDMSARFMTDLAVAENQRFANPTISDALENALSGVAAGSISPEKAMQDMQNVTAKVLKK